MTYQANATKNPIGRECLMNYVKLQIPDLRGFEPNPNRAITDRSQAIAAEQESAPSFQRKVRNASNVGSQFLSRQNFKTNAPARHLKVLSIVQFTLPSKIQP